MERRVDLRDSMTTYLDPEIVSEITNTGSNGAHSYLLLSTSLLVDRVYRHTDLVSTLLQTGSVNIWASSFNEQRKEADWTEVGATLRHFPEVRAFREFPHNFLRRLNEFVWDYRFTPPSRMSMMKHRRDKDMRWSLRALKLPAKLMAALGTERLLEKFIEELLVRYPRSQAAKHLLIETRPDVVLSTGPFQFEQPAIFSHARELGIPTLAYIPSWDNVSTKNRMVFNYDGYIVWNERIKKELHHFYPRTKNVPIYVVGSPQFDVFHQERFYTTREAFCARQGLDPELPIILYAIGSPNFLKEHHGAEYMARRVSNGDLGDVQLLVRPHPIHEDGAMSAMFDQYGSRVRVQKSPNAGKALNKRTQDEEQIIEWVNTFRHADVVVNLSSTVTIDAAIFDKPVVNLDFDPQPGQADQQLIKDVNHKWDHFKPIAESGGVWLVNDFNEMVNAIKTYLSEPSLHSQKRKRITEYVCGFTDGKCGERMAKAMNDFVARRKQKA
jgi:hypothetical protein